MHLLVPCDDPKLTEAPDTALLIQNALQNPGGVNVEM